MRSRQTPRRSPGRLTYVESCLPGLVVKILEVPGLTAHEEEGWIAVKYKVVKPRPRIRFSVKKLPVILVTLLYPYEGKFPDISVEKLSLSQDCEKKGVIGLRTRINDKPEPHILCSGGKRVLLQGHQARGAGRLSMMQEHKQPGMIVSGAPSGKEITINPARETCT